MNQKGYMYREDKIRKYIPSSWSSHPEYRIVIFYEGFGKWFVGHGMKEVGAGDIVFIGPDTEEIFLNDSVFFENNDLRCCWSVLSFYDDIFPVNFRIMPECDEIVSVLDKSRSGLLYHADDQLRQTLVALFDRFAGALGLNQILVLNEILLTLSRAGSGVQVSPSKTDASAKEQLPVYRTFNYLLKNLSEDIKLDEVASFAGQNASALCRSFKAATGQSIFSCLQELRLNQASRMLIESPLGIPQVAVECGFGSSTQFNRLFSKKMGIRAVDYRKLYQK